MMLSVCTTAEDVQAMLPLARRMHEESAFSFLPFMEGRVWQTLAHLATHHRLFLLRYDDGPGTDPLGFFCGQTDRYFFNNDKIASDLAFYVVPERRGNGAVVLRMIRMFEAWAKGKGAREVCLGISTGVHTDKTGALLGRAGYAHVGGTFKRRMI